VIGSFAEGGEVPLTDLARVVLLRVEKFPSQI